MLHFNVTANPTAEWTAQQIAEAFPWDSTPRFLLRDRDGIYSCYHRWRCHQSLEMDCPDRRKAHPVERGSVVEIEHLGGLHHHYERAAV